MSTTQPIRSKQLLHDFKNYYLTEQPEFRNYTIILIGLNTALRINDILHITWGDVYCGERRRFYTHHRKENRKRDPNPDQQRTSGNITVLPDNTAFHSRHRLPLPQPQKNRFPTLPIPGLPHCPQSRRSRRDRRCDPVSLPAEDLRLSCVENGNTSRPADGDLQSFFFSDHKTLSGN